MEASKRVVYAEHVGTGMLSVGGIYHATGDVGRRAAGWGTSGSRHSTSVH